MLNTTIIGNITIDPISRTVKVGDSEVTVCNFTVAANYGYGDRKKTQYIRCATWRGMAENCKKYLRKGSKVYLSGVVTPDQFIGNNNLVHLCMQMQVEKLEFLSAQAQANEEPTEPAVPMEDENAEIEAFY